MSHKKIDRLIYLFSKLPGLGNRTAKRIVLHLLKNKDRLMTPVAESLLDAANAIRACKSCNNLDEEEICYICNDHKRNNKIICIVESIVDLWALENARFYKGKYHVLGGTLSASNVDSVAKLDMSKLLNRIENEEIEEIIIATNATVEGQTTAFFITEKLKNYKIKVTRFAHGIPIGGELDYLDEVTLTAAFNTRQNFQETA